MQMFNGLQYLAISIANEVGMDKSPWDERLDWVKDNLAYLEDLEPTKSKNKFLYRKRVKALRDTLRGRKVHCPIDLDATNSGIQVMGAICKCRITGTNSNLIGKVRNDVYGQIRDQVPGRILDREVVKEATIPAIYNSVLEPMKIFGDGTPQLEAFWKGLYKAVPALRFLKELGIKLWDKEALYHEWTLKDGHIAKCPSTEQREMRISVLNTSFTYKWKKHMATENSVPLIVNIIHSLDGWVAREVVRRLKLLKIKCAHIHDSFWIEANHGNELRMVYLGVLIDMAREDTLNNIVQSIKPGFPRITFDQSELTMWEEMKEAEYPLS